MQELVFKGENNQALTNSLLVAEKFGKEHSKVMRDIENLSCSNEFRAANFGVSSYISQQNKDLPMYAMTKDGFSFLVMGYTGKRAGAFKEEYIKAFNIMDKTLKESQKPLSSVQMFALQASINLEHEQRLLSVEQKLAALSKEREENTVQLLSVPVSLEGTPEISLRDKIRQLVNNYSSSANIKQQDVWHKIYDQLYYLYHVSIKAYKKNERESLLDVAERNRLLDKIHAIISSMVRELKQRA